MNRLERLFGTSGEARVRYKDGDFQIISNGEFVRCAVTGARIHLNDLKYWNVERQEAYSSAAVSMQRAAELRRRGAG